MKLLRTIDSGLSGPKIAILACVHGDESYSLNVFRRLKKLHLLKGEISFYLVHPQAFTQKKRFIDEDLNRAFSKDSKSCEGNLTKIIKRELEKFDYVIDLHSTTSKTAPFLIYVNQELKKTGFLDLFFIKKRVFIPNARFSLIFQFNSAVSLEISVASGMKHAIKRGENVLLSFFANLELIQERKRKVCFPDSYFCLGTMKKKKSLKDFSLTRSEGEYVYPILSKEVSYEQYCFKAKRE